MIRQKNYDVVIFIIQPFGIHHIYSHCKSCSGSLSGRLPERRDK